MISKARILSIVFILFSYMLKAQFVGIGVSNPTFKLDVSGSFRIQNTSNTAGLWFDGNTLPTRSFIGTFTDDVFGLFGQAGAGWHFLMNHNNGNIGIGANPNFRLDVWGRIRIQKSAENSAGIWFDGITTTTRSFIGTQAANNLGIWGSGGAGWRLIMDVTNGNIGIGTTAPTKKLDVNTSLRIQSNSPVRGSVLISADASGNTEWANPVAFRGNSTVNHQDLTVPRNVWTKVIFHQAPDYNSGNNYIASTSDFIAPVDGIYEMQTSSLIGYLNEDSKILGVRLRLERAGNISTLAEIVDNGLASTNYDGFFRTTMPISADVRLNTGDKVWVEVYSTPEDNSPSRPLLGLNTTFFTGHLVTRL